MPYRAIGVFCLFILPQGESEERTMQLIIRVTILTKVPSNYWTRLQEKIDPGEREWKMAVLENGVSFERIEHLENNSAVPHYEVAQGFIAQLCRTAEFHSLTAQYILEGAFFALPDEVDPEIALKQLQI
jgi:hypothetical protein